MIPLFTPTISFSTRCPRRARCRPSVGVPTRSRRRGRSHGERGRRRQTAADRQITVDEDVESADVGADQRDGAAHVARPTVGGRREQGVDRRLVALVETRRDRAHGTVPASAHGDVGAEIEGCRQREAVVVVGVLADQVHPARRADHDVWRRAEQSAELVDDHRRDSGTADDPTKGRCCGRLRDLRRPASRRARHRLRRRASTATSGCCGDDGRIESWRLLRRKLGLGGTHEFKVLIETRDLAQLDRGLRRGRSTRRTGRGRPRRRQLTRHQLPRPRCTATSPTPHAPVRRRTLLSAS